MNEQVETLDVLDDEEGTSSLRSNAVRVLGSWRLAGIVIPFLILFTSLSIWVGPFFTKTNLINILDQQSAYLAIAAAGTLVLVAGGLDLSVGAIYGLAAVVSGQLAEHHSPVIAIGAGLLVGLGMGIGQRDDRGVPQDQPAHRHPGDVVRDRWRRAQGVGEQPHRPLAELRFL